MDRTRTSLWLFLLLSRLPLCATDDGRSLLTARPTDASPPTSGSMPARLATGPPTSGAMPARLTTGPPASGARVDCLMDTEMGLVAVGSAAALIVCLLGATAVLACQVCLIQRRVYAPRSTRSNLDLVSGAGYWGLERPGSGGHVGPCDGDVALEEVRSDEEAEEERRGREAEDGPEEKVSLMQRSPSRDSSLVSPRDLEDMPLVV
ncbi:uncharacterized protein LOC119216343 [Pungitius pungitius]|uniref:uncharacterized protein LOC119216343 n=1 Tax=Pungitius pungitius TaxID=134920 RepID=UPI001886CBB1|nr:uncharacterized protein LOC119216343 [Pungitius pungitius]